MVRIVLTSVCLNSVIEVKPSQLANTHGSNYALANITMYYAREKGFKGRIFCDPKNKEGEGAHYNSLTKSITSNFSAFKSGFFDNFFNFKSALNHKIGHSKEKIPEKEYKYSDHANIYLNESKTNDFKNSDPWYRASNANEFMCRMLKGEEKGEPQSGDYIKNYNNSNNGGVQITPGFQTLQGDGTINLSFDISVEGVPYKNKGYDSGKLTKPKD